MKKIIIKFILLGLSISLNSCSPEEKVNNVVPTSPINPSTYYIAGSKNGFACYWKNNQLIPLDSGTLNRSTAIKIIELNGDVYVFGNGDNANGYKILFWKNGVLTNLTDQFSTATYSASIKDMTIVGNDVYFVGYTYQKPFNFNNPSSLVYWKNNIKNVIDTYSEYVSSQSRIAVVANDIYALGAGNLNFSAQGYYVNGVYNELLQNDLNGISVNKNNDDVYIAGRVNGAYYYKNLSTNTAEYIPSTSSDWLKIDFDEYNNRYTGYGDKIFKNGENIYDASGAINSQLVSFKFLNDNKYILTTYGFDAVNSGHTTLTINGNNVMQSGNNESFSSFFVVQN